MAKRVCVIDIGSNSIRMAIYEKTSRFAFHLLYETKSKVRLSQNIYQNSGNLQNEAMDRTFDALENFISISKSFNVRKTLCVATSALRDAPNKKDFLSRVKNKLQLNIKIIDGQKEAYLGAMACANLLPSQTNALSIDIGGGSTEFARIHEDKVSNTLSLELGTVRLKELYFDKDDINGAISYIDSQLSALDSLEVSTLIGIGGTFRALASAMMKHYEYPLNKIHAFECTPQNYINYIDQILEADNHELERLGIKKNRFDIIKPGTLILQRVFIKLCIKKVFASGVGVREGVFLRDLLRNSKDRFPHNYNTSVRYLIDANVQESNFSNQIAHVSKKLFDLTHSHFSIDVKYRYDLAVASRLYPAGNNIHYFSHNRHSYHLVKSTLEYGFTHSQIMLIATLVRYAKNKLPSSKHIKKYERLLPDATTINILNYILSLSISLLAHRPRNIDFDMEFEDGVIQVNTSKNLYLAKEALAKVSEIENIKIVF
ncbi:MAG: Ppx/GppA phosphatase family protein [Sulfurimonas sp.]|nr:Ppx/GppA phosphatase family protein [Sulfurimonas sp.]MDQ7062467.1 Ppx/GppA phosphatase family protein [Sulfurimonas sp.]